MLVSKTMRQEFESLLTCHFSTNRNSTLQAQMTYIDPTPCPPQHREFFIEAVIVCDRYSDFLRHTLPANKHLFDRLVVVTSYEDKETQRVCEYNHVEVIRTDATESRKGKFCKGVAINVGLGTLSKQDWVVHLDADILLPPQTRILLKRAELDKSMIYGIDRFNIHGYKQWEEFQRVPKLQHECDAYIHLNPLPLCTRVMSAAGGGYIPIGFTQIFNPLGSGISRYPEGHTDAGREDMLFAKLWPRSKRGFIPEIVGYHLESDDASMSSNWKGRTTSLFQ